MCKPFFFFSSPPFVTSVKLEVCISESILAGHRVEFTKGVYMRCGRRRAASVLLSFGAVSVGKRRTEVVMVAGPKRSLLSSAPGSARPHRLGDGTAWHEPPFPARLGSWTCSGWLAADTSTPPASPRPRRLRPTANPRPPNAHG